MANTLRSRPRHSQQTRSAPSSWRRSGSSSTRVWHWNRVRCAVGLGNVDLYTATRHYFGWYAWNVLELDARDIALRFGHPDGGELVRKLYGHPDAARARERVREAFKQAPPAPLPLLATGR